MKRVQATNLVMVNWKGVFYARYELHPRVTALEGVNGAGKTTVLVAAYIAMLPDMARLRFTNVGEHGATGGDKGIWGRLGEPGAPSYTALEYRLPEGERLVAGVHLQRRSEPTVEPTAFFVTGLRDDVSLQDVFLDRGDLDSVPNLSRFRELVARAGARLDVCDSAKEYFGTLFDRGVTPLRLASDEERGKFNEMLRATMTGGLSRELTAEGLRRFLLREETGLAETLTRMRASLDACRVTRLEVETSRRLEQEIRDVYEAGEEMFACAVLDIRERAAESRRRREEANDRLERTLIEHRSLLRRIEDLTEQLNVLSTRLEEARRERDTAKQVVNALERARRVAARIGTLSRERLPLAERFDSAQCALEEAEKALALARRDLESAQGDREAAAQGLESLQRGIEELARRAAEHRLAVDRLELVRARCAEDFSGPEDLHALVAALADRIGTADVELARLEREVATAEVRRREFDACRAALARLVEQPFTEDGAFAVASAALADLHDLEQLANEHDRIKAEIEELGVLVERRNSVTRRAAPLFEEGASQKTVLDEAQLLNAQIQEVMERLAETRLAMSTATQADRALALRIDDVERIARWRDVRSRANRLATIHGPLATREDLAALLRRLSNRRDIFRREVEELEARAESLRGEVKRIERGAGARDPRLIEARHAAGGELLAERFDDVALEDAARMEALLGPLSDALVVDDARSAAGRILAEAAELPDMVILLEREAAAAISPTDITGEILRDAAFVQDGGQARLTRIPDVPTLGMRARKKRMAALLEEAKQSEAKAAQAHSELEALDVALAELELLLPEADLLARANPEEELRNLRLDASRLEDELRAHGAKITVDEDLLGRYRSRRAEVHALISEAWLLDRHDLDDRLGRSKNRLKAAARARERLILVAADRAIVRANLDALRVPPQSPESVEASRERAEELKRIAEDWRRARNDASWVAEHRGALGWTDAERELEAKSEVTPALKRQLEDAKIRSNEAKEHHEKKDEERSARRSALSEANAALKAIDASIEQHRRELAEIGVTDTSDDAWAQVSRELNRSDQEVVRLDGEHRGVEKELAVANDRAKGVGAQVETRRQELDEADRAWRPQQERWERIHRDAAEQGLLGQALADRYVSRYEGKGSANIANEAKSQARLVIERLSHASDGAEPAALLRNFLDAAALGERCIEAWTHVRSWIQRRLPSQIADEPDPRVALGRLREQLVRLQETLERQERELRGDSENVARNIENQKRRARRQIQLLNNDLDHVRFGSISGVQIAVSSVDQMERVLEALRTGEAKDLLFKPDMPIEQAIEELFRRHGGGQTGGTKLLDYREYLDLRVEVRRMGGATWELANAARMSTGEAIGVGAALMMVVLAAWERDAALFRPKRASGTLRLLLLDEANRLSSDSLAVMFELCEGLDLQLILAAPEVAQSRGNTTYRLVRRVVGGREEVIVTGRRAAVPLA